MAVEIPPSGTRGARGAPTGPVGRVIMGVARRFHRLTGNKMGGNPLLYLTTVGAKSGQRRTSAVMAFPDGDDAWLVVGSRGGSAKNPAWCYNIAAHPDQVEVEFDGRKTAVTPRVLTGDERAAAWQRITGEQHNFAEYETKTDRQIPVIRLTAR